MPPRYNDSARCSWMRLLLCLLWMLAVSAEASAADTASFDPKPWLADLQQIRVALSEM
jgi:hypothetical protein